MKKVILLFVIATFTFSCNQRIELDEGQWGTHANVTSGIFLYKWTLGTVQLAEGNVEGAKREDVTSGTDVDDVSLIVTTTVKAGTDLSKVACLIYHDGVKVEPLNGAPIPGRISDYSAKEFKYRIYSADGNHKDWTLKVVQ